MENSEFIKSEEKTENNNEIKIEEKIEKNNDKMNKNNINDNIIKKRFENGLETEIEYEEKEELVKTFESQFFKSL